MTVLNPSSSTEPRWTPDPVADAYDREAWDYDGFYRSPRCRAEDRELIARLFAFLRQSDTTRVLDVGCGTGALLNLIPFPIDRYVGVDVSANMLNVARSRFPLHRFERFSVLDLPWLDGTFTVAVALFSALSHIAAPVRALAEILRVLQPKSRCFLMVYAPRWHYRNPQRAGRLYVETSPAAWSVWQARERMNCAGFKHVAISGFSILPAPLLRVERPLARLAPHAGRYLVIEAIAP